LTNWRVVIAVLMLLTWATGTVLAWGGWVAGLLTAGVFLLVWAITRKNKPQTANRKRQK
jgi:hypothetical protein